MHRRLRARMELASGDGLARCKALAAVCRKSRLCSDSLISRINTNENLVSITIFFKGVVSASTDRWSEFVCEINHWYRHGPAVFTH